MKRYKLHDRKVHDGQVFNYRTGERWAVLDTQTNRIVDEGTTRYEAQQAVNNWNAGLHDEEVTAELVDTLNSEGPLRGLVEATPTTEEYAVTITSQRTKDGVTTANTSTVAKFDSHGLNVEEVARAGYQGIVSYHLAEGDVAALYRIDRRGDWHLIVRSDQKPATSPYVDHLMQEVVATLPPACEWFARCIRPAAGHVDHPVLGKVPTCQRCADKFELVLVPN